MNNTNKKYTIAVAGTSYVGLSIATLLAQHYQVYAVDIIPEKVEMINQRKSPILDEYIEKYLTEKELDLTATLDAEKAYSVADFVVITTPTNYDSTTQHFDMSAVEAVIELVMKYNPDAFMVIKSMIPGGYTENIRKKAGNKNILFSPEFLRESKALYDNLYPSRIIDGTDKDDEHLVEAAHTFAELLQEGAIKEDIDTLFLGFTEAEAVKLFANTYRLFAWRILTSWIHTLRVREWIRRPLLTVCVWIREAALITTIRVSDTVAIACRRTRSSC